MRAIPLREHFADIAGPFPVIFCDIWGVVHNGRDALAPAVACLAQMRALGHTVILISNAPRPSSEIPAQFDQIGVDHGCYDAIVTSGDATRHIIEGHAAGRTVRVHHIGPERDLPLFAGLDVRLTSLPDADLVVCSGLLHDDTETPADYDPVLREIAAMGKDFICANPDRVVQKGDRLIYCAGALADRVAAHGGNVIAPGKPNAPIYDLCRIRAEGLRGTPVGKDAILAVGDGLPTDIAGAAAFGIDCVFIASGIHAQDYMKGGAWDGAALAAASAQVGAAPLAAMRWLAL